MGKCHYLEFSINGKGGSVFCDQYPIALTKDDQMDSFLLDSYWEPATKILHNSFNGTSQQVGQVDVMVVDEERIFIREWSQDPVKKMRRRE